MRPLARAHFDHQMAGRADEPPGLRLVGLARAAGRDPAGIRRAIQLVGTVTDRSAGTVTCPAITSSSVPSRKSRLPVSYIIEIMPQST